MKTTNTMEKQLRNRKLRITPFLIAGIIICMVLAFSGCGRSGGSGGSDHSDSQSDADSSEPKVKSTEIRGLESTYNKAVSEDITLELSITPDQKRSVTLEMWTDGDWESKGEFETAKAKDSSDVEESGDTGDSSDAGESGDADEGTDVDKKTDANESDEKAEKEDEAKSEDGDNSNNGDSANVSDDEDDNDADSGYDIDPEGGSSTGEHSDAAAYEVSIKLPEDWKKTTYTKWRVHIPEIKKKGVTYQESEQEFMVVASNLKELELNSESACLLDEDGNILYAKNPDKELPMASTTKLMTGLLAFEEGDMEQEYTFSQEAADIDYDKLGAPFVGKQLTFSELCKAAMICSSNGAAYEIANAVAGSQSDFAERMNSKAEELGMKHTHYVNPHGLHDSAQYSSAYDGAILMKQAYQFEDLRSLLSTKSAEVSSVDGSARKTIETTNTMLGSVEGIAAAKTGWVEESGSCIIEAYETGGKVYFICTLGAHGEKEYAKSKRDEDSKMLFDYIKENVNDIESENGGSTDDESMENGSEDNDSSDNESTDDESINDDE